jgi:multidrug efflux pump subunit AcrB
MVRVKDVASVELGAEFYKSFGRYNGKPAGVLLLYLLPGANQVESAHGVYQALERAEEVLPRRRGLRHHLRLHPRGGGLHRGNRPHPV